MLQELNKAQLKYCNIFIDSWEATVLLELRANLKDKDLVSMNLSKLLAMRNHRLSRQKQISLVQQSF